MDSTKYSRPSLVLMSSLPYHELGTASPPRRKKRGALSKRSSRASLMRSNPRSTPYLPSSTPSEIKHERCNHSSSLPSRASVVVGEVEYRVLVLWVVVSRVARPISSESVVLSYLLRLSPGTSRQIGSSEMDLLQSMSISDRSISTTKLMRIALSLR